MAVIRSTSKLHLMPRAHPSHGVPKFKIFGKFACPCPIKGLRFPYLMTETHPQNRRFGYARVSTVGQTLDSLLEQLRAAAAPPRFTARR